MSEPNQAFCDTDLKVLIMLKSSLIKGIGGGCGYGVGVGGRGEGYICLKFYFLCCIQFPVQTCVLKVKAP